MMGGGGAGTAAALGTTTPLSGAAGVDPSAGVTTSNGVALTSGRCHLGFACRAVLICVQRSFLHDLDRLIDCSHSLNCVLPSCVI